MEGVPLQIGLDYLITYLTAPVQAGQLILQTQNDIASLHPRMRFRSVLHILEHIAWGKASLNAVWKGSNSLLLERALTSVLHALYLDELRSLSRRFNLTLPRTYAEGPDYSYVMDAPDPGAEVIEEDETPERVQQTTLDAMRTVAKTMRREVEELSSEEENVSRTGRASLDAWKRQKEMAKGRASQETKKGKKNDDDPLKAAGLSFDEFIANTEAQQHEANVVDEAVKYEMELETTTLRLKGMFAELFERVEHQRNIAESILRAKGLTWTDVIGHELPPASTFHSTPMPTPYSVDEAKASMKETEKSVREEYEALRRDGRQQGREEIVRVMLTTQLKDSGLPLSADEIIRLLRDPRRADAFMQLLQTAHETMKKKREELLKKPGEEGGEEEGRGGGEEERDEGEEGDDEEEEEEDEEIELKPKEGGDEQKKTKEGEEEEKKKKKTTTTTTAKKKRKLTKEEIQKKKEQRILDVSPEAAWSTREKVNQVKRGELLAVLTKESETLTEEQLTQEKEELLAVRWLLLDFWKRHQQVIPEVEDLWKMIRKMRQTERKGGVLYAQELRLKALIDDALRLKQELGEEFPSEAKVMEEEENMRATKKKTWIAERQRQKEALIAKLAQEEHEKKKAEKKEAKAKAAEEKKQSKEASESKARQPDAIQEALPGLKGVYSTSSSPAPSASTLPTSPPHLPQKPPAPPSPEQQTLDEMNEQIKLQAEALFEVLQPTATAQEREIGVEQLTYILDLAYSDLTNPEMVDLVETARAILMAKQKVATSSDVLVDSRFPVLEAEALKAVKARLPAEMSRVEEEDEKRKKLERIIAGTEVGDEERAKAQAELVVLIAEEEERPISAKSLISVRDLLAKAAKAREDAEFATRLNEAVGKRVLQETASTSARTEEIVQEEKERLTREKQLVADDETDDFPGSAPQIVLDFLQSQIVAPLRTSLLHESFLHAESCLTSKRLDEESYLAIELLRRARKWQLTQRKDVPPAPSAEDFTAQVRAQREQAERERRAMRKTLDVITRNVHLVIDREIPSRLKPLSAAQKLRQLTLIDRRFRGLKVALTPAEQQEFEEMMNPFEVARLFLEDETNRSFIAHHYPAFTQLSPQQQITYAAGIVADIDASQIQSEITSDQSPPPPPRSILEASELSAQEIARHLATSDVKEMENAAKALADLVTKDESCRMLIAAMDPRTAALLDDPEKLYKTILRLLRSRVAKPEKKRKARAEKLKASFLKSPLRSRLSKELQESLSDEATLMKRCLAAVEQEEKEIEAKAKLVRATIMENLDCLKVVKELHPAKRYLFRNAEKLLQACEDYVRHDLEIEVYAVYVANTLCQDPKFKARFPKWVARRPDMERMIATRLKEQRLSKHPHAKAARTEFRVERFIHRLDSKQFSPVWMEIDTLGENGDNDENINYHKDAVERLKAREKTRREKGWPEICNLFAAHFTTIAALDLPDADDPLQLYDELSSLAKRRLTEEELMKELQSLAKQRMKKNGPMSKKFRSMARTFLQHLPEEVEEQPEDGSQPVATSIATFTPSDQPASSLPVTVSPTPSPIEATEPIEPITKAPPSTILPPSSSPSSAASPPPPPRDIYASLDAAQAVVARALELEEKHLQDPEFIKLLNEVTAFTKPANRDERRRRVLASLKPEQRKDPKVMEAIEKLVQDDDVAPVFLTVEFVQQTIEKAVKGEALPDTKKMKEEVAAKIDERLAGKEAVVETKQQEEHRVLNERLVELEKMQRDHVHAMRAANYATPIPVVETTSCPSFGARLLRFSLDLAFETSLKAVLHPITVAGVKFVQDVSWGRFRSSLETAQILYSTPDGWCAFIEGLYPSLLGTVVAHTVNFVSLEFFSFVSRRLSTLEPPFEPVYIPPFFPAYVSHIVSYLASYPFTTISKRMMTQAGEDFMWYTSARNAYDMILEREGYAGLYVGAEIGLALSVASSAIRDYITHRAKQWKPPSIKEERYSQRMVNQEDDLDDREYENEDTRHEIRKTKILLHKYPAIDQLIKRQEEEKKAVAEKLDKAAVPARLRKLIGDEESTRLLKPLEARLPPVPPSLSKTPSSAAKSKGSSAKEETEQPKPPQMSSVKQWLEQRRTWKSRSSAMEETLESVLQNYERTAESERGPTSRRKQRKERALRRQVHRTMTGGSKLPSELLKEAEDEEEKDKKEEEEEMKKEVEEAVKEDKKEEEEEKKGKRADFPTEGDEDLDRIERQVMEAVGEVYGQQLLSSVLEDEEGVDYGDDEEKPDSDDVEVAEKEAEEAVKRAAALAVEAEERDARQEEVEEEEEEEVEEEEEEEEEEEVEDEEEEEHDE